MEPKVKNVILTFLLLALVAACGSKDSSSGSAVNVEGNALSCPGAIQEGDCPTGYVRVRGNAAFGLCDFCVMQFEAKIATAEDGPVSSVGEGEPKAGLSAEGAFDACAALNDEAEAADDAVVSGTQLKSRAEEEAEGEGVYALISNSEWMVIARDIAGTENNWKIVDGQREFYAGHSDFEPASALPVTDIGNNSVGTGTEPQKRVHHLSSNTALWDFAGNLAEWVDWVRDDEKFSVGPTDTEITFGGRYPLTLVFGSLAADELQPGNGLGQKKERLGQWIGGSAGQGAATRGGDWRSGKGAGVFALNLSHDPSDAAGTIGFRCVYRPHESEYVAPDTEAPVLSINGLQGNIFDTGKAAYAVSGSCSEAGRKVTVSLRDTVPEAEIATAQVHELSQRGRL